MWKKLLIEFQWRLTIVLVYVMQILCVHDMHNYSNTRMKCYNCGMTKEGQCDE